MHVLAIDKDLAGSRSFQAQDEFGRWFASDSPTSARVSPCCSEKLMSSTALTRWFHQHQAFGNGKMLLQILDVDEWGVCHGPSNLQQSAVWDSLTVNDGGYSLSRFSVYGQRAANRHPVGRFHRAGLAVDGIEPSDALF